MNYTKTLNIKEGKAICYSGFREGQQPGGICPSYDEIKEDLLMLQGEWKYLRLYDCDDHAAIVLEVIKKEKLAFKVMLGAYIIAEMNNFGCPWEVHILSEEELAQNKLKNKQQIQKLIDLANQYPDIIMSLSAGNEACVDWTDHYVSVKSVINYVKQIKKGAKQPVTFCENYVPWLDKLKDLGELFKTGAINKEEFEKLKHEILNPLEGIKKNPKLIELEELLSSGALTKEEFEVLKKEIIDDDISADLDIIAPVKFEFKPKISEKYSIKSTVSSMSA